MVVGTPGRLGKHLRDGNLVLRDLRVLVLDEADRMLDMGFADQVQSVVRRSPRERQTLFFSATFSPEIESLSEEVQQDALHIAVESQVEPTTLRQRYFECERSERRDVLVRILAKYRPETALLFCETRDDCDALTAFLNERGAVALGLHGQMEQRDRDEVLLRFANGSASFWWPPTWPPEGLTSSLARRDHHRAVQRSEPRASHWSTGRGRKGHRPEPSQVRQSADARTDRGFHG